LASNKSKKDMKSQKNKLKTPSDTDKALAKVGQVAIKKGKPAKSADISLDSVIAEKDEVKNAEERMRQQTKKKN
jgi:hypothetical protein